VAVKKLKINYKN